MVSGTEVGNANVRVAAVIVTYNRKELLCECLDALLAQSFPLAGIVLIDNAGSDGTGALLKEKGYLESGLCKYIRMEVNTGGAGGFHEGVKRAYDEGYDWLWLMDDDVEPMPERAREYVAVRQCVASAFRHARCSRMGPRRVGRGGRALTTPVVALARKNRTMISS